MRAAPWYETDMCRQNQVWRLSKWLVRHKSEERSSPDLMQLHAGIAGLGRDTDGARTLWACILYVWRKYESVRVVHTCTQRNH